MRLLSPILAGLVLTGLPGSMMAQCGYRNYYQPYYPPVVREIVKEVIVATYLPVAVAVPTVAVGYGLPAFAAAAPTAAALTPAVAPAASLPSAPAAVASQAAGASPEQFSDAFYERFLTGMESYLAKKQGKAPPVAATAPEQAQAAPQATGDVVALFTAKCAKCHTGEGSKGPMVNGKLSPFRMFDAPGKLAALDAGARAKIALQTTTALMPEGAQGNPKSPLAVTDQEQSIINQWALAR